MAPFAELYARQLQKAMLDHLRLEEAVNDACVRMLYGNRGAHMVVFVEYGAGYSGVSLIDVDREPHRIPALLADALPDLVGSIVRWDRRGWDAVVDR